MRPAFCAIALLCSASPAIASGVTVAPTTIVLTRESSKSSLTVRNESTAPLRLRVQPVVWTNGPGGQLETSPTDDLIAFPTLLQIEPGQARRIRVGAQVAPARDERTYRLLITELGPGAESSDAVTFRMQLSVPVFLWPRDRTATIDLPPPTVNHNAVQLRLVNSGHVHLTPTRIETTGRDSNGIVVWSRTFRPWYLLAGESRDHEALLTDEECQRTAAVAVEFAFAERPAGPIRAQRALGAAACRRP